MKRIVVDPPISEARRERVERQLFQQLAAVRVADRADAVIPRPKKRHTSWYAMAGLAAAAAAIVLLVARDESPAPTVAAPSRVVAPVDRDTQFTIGHDAVVVAKADTSVEWQQATDGSIVLKLERGAVDCDVEPRRGRAPFKVISGDVTVIVVGTRFTVTKTPMPRVDVAHGKVRVEAPGGTWFVEAGEAWTPVGATRPETVTAPVTVTVTDSEPEPVPEIEMDPINVARAKKASPPSEPEAGSRKPDPRPDPKRISPPTTRELAAEAFRAANRLEVTDPGLAAANYRAIALGKDAGWAATALVALAELRLRQDDPQAALDVLDEHARKFPHSRMREDAAWDRIEALRALGKREEARGAAAEYLREYPDGVYAKPAARLVK